MNSDSAVVFDKSELAKSIHEKAHTRAGSADHLREGFLRDFGNALFPFARLAKFRHQQEYSRKPFFARVEKLIDQIGLNSHTAL
jgi:hypothetical protein